MKKIIMITLALFLFNSNLKAQGATYNYYKGFLQGYGYTICQEWSARLKQGEYFTKTFIFDRDIQYDLLAFSEDGDVLDVDITIYNSSGDVYTKDTKTDKLAGVNFTPYYDRTLTIVVKNYRSRTPNYASNVYLFIGYR